jgi:hypothetical protein
MYAPMINTATDEIKAEIGECDLIIKFGNAYFPLQCDAEIEKFLSENNGTKLVIKPDTDKIATKGGEIKIACCECRINGSEKSTDRFYCRVAVKRDKNIKSKDVVDGTVILSLMENGDVEKLKTLISTPTTGNVSYTHRWYYDTFKFGEYPVVNLSKEKREANGKSWTNYCVSVITESGTIVKVMMEMRHQTIWNTLSNFYDVIDENGVIHSPNNDDDFFGSPANDKFVIVYSNKKEYTELKEGKQVKRYEIDMSFKPSSSSSWSPISREVVTQPTQSEPTQNQPFTAGVDDLLVNAF